MSVMPLRQQMPRENEPQIEQPDLGGENEAPTTDKRKRTRGQSTIAFPYADLDDAVVIARTIHEKGGAPLAKDQIAAAIGHAVTSGTFSAKLHASRMFGFIEFTPGKIKLTELGHEAVGSDVIRAKVAKAKAFLNVPLFEKAYREFRNKTLPSRPQGLEQAFIGFGVLSTRRVNARWAFDRSARQAGFFEHSDERLVQPVYGSNMPDVTEAGGETPDKEKPIPKSPSAAADEFLIRGLLTRMPAPNTDWSLHERVRWLRAFSVNLAMLYGSSDEREIQISLPEPVAPKRAPSAPPSRPVSEADEPEPTPQTGGELDDDIPF